MADQEKKPRGITSIAVSGFKSLRDETRIAIRPLTVLAGANSSGKSSIMQPLLMLKQTLDSPNDPGALLLNGQNVDFSDPDQFLSADSKSREFKIELEFDRGLGITGIYAATRDNTVEISEITYKSVESITHLTPTLHGAELVDQLPPKIKIRGMTDQSLFGDEFEWQVIRRRCFLLPTLANTMSETSDFSPTRGLASFEFDATVAQHIYHISRVIHLSGFRGNPRRAYPRTTVVEFPFSGTFEYYAASVIEHWFRQKHENVHQLVDHLKLLRLSDTIEVLPASTTVELRVNRFPVNPNRVSEPDTVNIADVGFGVSQALPVLVALLVAEPGQLVYIEQPELHLHPRAQVALAQVLADAANRGVRVVIETHSDLVLLGIQTLVAKKALAADDVIFHWFTRNAEGVTQVDSTDLDELGRYNNTKWKEDFGDIRLQAQSEYLDAGLDMEEA